MNLSKDLLLHSLSFMTPKEICKSNYNKKFIHIQKKAIIRGLSKRFTSKERKKELLTSIFKNQPLKTLKLASKQNLIRYYFSLSNETYDSDLCSFKTLTWTSILQLLHLVSYDELVDTMVSVNPARRSYDPPSDEEKESYSEKYPTKNILLTHIKNVFKRNRSARGSIIASLCKEELLKHLSENVLAKAVQNYITRIGRYYEAKFVYETDVLKISNKDYIDLLKHLTKLQLCLIIKGME